MRIFSARSPFLFFDKIVRGVGVDDDAASPLLGGFYLRDFLFF